MKFKMLGVMILAAVLVVPASADEADGAKKKGKGARGASASGQILKQLESVSLTDEQTTKIKELGKAADAAMKTIREESGLTAELMKKRADAQKELKDSGKKGKEMAAAVNEAAGLSEAQSAAFGKLNDARMKFQKEVVGLLTDDQKASLPQQLMRAGKEGKKKKKDAA
ncbi:hypothetical protein Poly51_50900 [Rubripirellula tenax]|uniref:LTXXQ motif protein n=1 Tax=Rubripirellula tenax TaxID=2528015 RepID=A0A5C6EHX3_9BACT|nr:Spy/CpxP family protein refolding chaperone [Rubripirellula tenax]TWU47291.1 hypothetical protein Poly51_50900 [Rubripirellula tenax]